MITLAVERGLVAIAMDWGVEQCLECGVCAYVCPSKRPMSELIHRALLYCGRDSEPLDDETKFDFPAVPYPKEPGEKEVLIEAQ